MWLSGRRHQLWGIDSILGAEKFGDKPIVLVIGNHEFYDRHWNCCLMDMRDAAKRTGVHFLENDAITITGVDFLGATLWTDFELYGSKSESITDASRYVADYRQIAGCSRWKTWIGTVQAAPGWPSNWPAGR